MPRPTRTPLPGEAELPEGQIDELRKLAREKVEKERRDQTRADLLKTFEAEERAKGDVGEDIIQHTIQLPPNAAFININGNRYMHGVTYEFGRKSYNSVVEMEQNAWRHEEVTMGQRNPNQFRRPEFKTLSAGMSAEQILQPRAF